MIGTDLHGVPDGITFAVVGVRADVGVQRSGRANSLGDGQQTWPLLKKTLLRASRGRLTLSWRCLVKV